MEKTYKVTIYIERTTEITTSEDTDRSEIAQMARDQMGLGNTIDGEVNYSVDDV